MFSNLIKEFISPAIGGGFIFKTLGFIFVSLSSATAFIIKHFYDIETKMEILQEGMTILHEKVDQVLEVENQKVLKEAEKSYFDYSSYITYNMLFKVCIVVTCIVGGVYCYNHFIVSSSVIQTISDSTAFNKESFKTLNEGLINTTKNINETTVQNMKEGTTCVIEALQNSNQLLTNQVNTLSQEMSNGFMKITQLMTELFEKQNTTIIELSIQKIKLLKDLSHYFEKKDIINNPNNDFEISLQPIKALWNLGKDKE